MCHQKHQRFPSALQLRRQQAAGRRPTGEAAQNCRQPGDPHSAQIHQRTVHLTTARPPASFSEPGAAQRVSESSSLQREPRVRPGFEGEGALGPVVPLLLPRERLQIGLSENGFHNSGSSNQLFKTSLPPQIHRLSLLAG